MLMAAARLDIPCIFVPGGCMISGPAFGGQQKTDSTTVSEAMGKMQTGEIDLDEVLRIGHLCTPTCGSCQFMGTANSMCCLAEALGMTLTGGALIPAAYNERVRSAITAVKRLSTCQKRDYRQADHVQRGPRKCRDDHDGCGRLHQYGDPQLRYCP